MDQPVSRKAWRQYYESALDELDVGNAEEKIHLAEEALFLRWQQLVGQEDNHGERNEMMRASYKLLRVKTNRLHWPDIRSSYSEGNQNQQRSEPEKQQFVESQQTD
jgi:hypothetical protein